MSRAAHPAGPRHADLLPPGRPPPPADLAPLDPAVWPRSARREGGALVLGDLDVRELAARFGTPLFACDEEDFRGRCRDFRGRCRDFREAFGEHARVSYASRAFCCTAVPRWASEEGLGVDVCTGGELATALRAGVPPPSITVHGSSKLPAEPAAALSAGVGCIVADSLHEVARLSEMTERGASPGPPARPRPRVPVRVTPGVQAAAHEFVATAHEDQKFGFSLGSGAAAEAVRAGLDRAGLDRAGLDLAGLDLAGLDLAGLDLAGLHSHIGSQIYDTAGSEVAAHRLVDFAAALRGSAGIGIREPNLGCGFGIAYQTGDDPESAKAVADGLRSIIEEQCGAAGLPVPRLSVEPAGRSPGRAP